MKTYKTLATKLNAMENCRKSGNTEWEARHAMSIEDIMETAPSGSGFDSGTKIDNKTTGRKLVFSTSFHHMDENGMYDGWTNHWVTVKPSLMFDFELTISGPDKNGIKEYIHEVFSTWLDSEIPSFAE